ncbi:MAG: response regulator [SAR324 cluster bacterium]|jgi:PAS domain S-box-containing protein|nr:PAS sensor protein [Pseudomonadota bacterium]MBI14454.1 PAS sensor protein [Deltaproteobacteria bacterium]MDP6090556.1 response regulator [SAR324 cluster bacterium]MBP43035.1 PAS sensor protein [Deltaproteobacteria bacterium]MDP6245957.1 response regulator [SAR324 cluster bacterium]|tara:strand:+ start:2613 stop:3653 length:1041 start_codon:yes stop_codon:yes gene_type:complete
MKSYFANQKGSPDASKILIVEDEAIVAESLNDQLIHLGYQVCGTAANGEDALRIMENSNPDLVMMDIMLEGSMDGVEVASRIHEKKGIPVIFLSAYSDNETLQRAKVTEPFGYLIKPYKERELHTNIEVSLYRHRMEQRVKEHERWLDLLLKSISEGVITVGLDGSVTSMSPAAEEMMGWSENTALGHELQEIMQLEEASKYPVVPDLIDQALDGENVECLTDEDPVLISRDGHRIMIDAAAAPILNEQEEITGAVLTIRNVSSRKKAEMELAEARNLLTNLLTPREKEILSMIVNGLTTKEIAYDLEISPRTVEAHRQNMMNKLQVVDMPMLVRCAVTHRLVPIE